MKPRSKFEHQVYNLSRELPKLTPEQENWARKECLQHIGYRNKKGISCLDCGHHWDGPQEANYCDCPSCGTRLKLETTRKKNLDQKNKSFAIIDVCEEFQLVRIFEVFAYHKAGKERRIFIWEVIQQFIIPGGKHQFVARLRNLNYYSDNFHGDMEIRDRNNIDKYNLLPDKVFPKMKVLSIYKRNGLKNSFRGISPFRMFKRLIDDSKFETLLKSGQFNLMQARSQSNSSYNIEWYWDSIKICIRNNYIVKDASIWFDHLRLLQRQDKDLRSPKYICPQNLIKEHNRLVRKVNERRDREELERKKKKIAESQELYEQQKKAFFGFILKKKNITIKVLESVEEFLEESNIHKHCLFSNSYYAKKDSLILSARVNRTPVETIEISLSEMKIIQSRGLQNKASSYNKEIVNLVNKNLDKIRKIYTKAQSVKRNVEGVAV